MRNLKVVIVLIAVCVSSCTAYRAGRQQKKVDKAIGVVLSNPDAREQIFQIQLGLHPVYSNPIIIKGKDSIIHSTDTLVIDRVKDSLIKADCPHLNLDSLRKANTFFRDHYRVDTLKVVDSFYYRKYQSANDDRNVLIGTVTQLNKDLSATKKESKGRLWWMIGISVFSFLAIGGLTYLLFKK